MSPGRAETKRAQHSDGMGEAEGAVMLRSRLAKLEHRMEAAERSKRSTMESVVTQLSALRRWLAERKVTPEQAFEQRLRAPFSVTIEQAVSARERVRQWRLQRFGVVNSGLDQAMPANGDP
jgi:hypothetical protein